MSAADHQCDFLSDAMQRSAALLAASPAASFYEQPHSLCLPHLEPNRVRRMLRNRLVDSLQPNLGRGQ